MVRQYSSHRSDGRWLSLFAVLIICAIVFSAVFAGFLANKYVGVVHDVSTTRIVVSSNVTVVSSVTVYSTVTVFLKSGAVAGNSSFLPGQVFP